MRKLEVKEVISKNIFIEKSELINDLKIGMLQRKSQFLLIIPTYNEIENISKLINCIQKDISIPAEIIVVDDNSPDGTANKVLDLKGDIPNIHLLKRSAKMGLGTAYMSGFKIGHEAGFKYFITMDSDLSHPPEVINRMAAEILNNDIVIGSRYCPEGKVLNFPPWRILLSKGGNLLAKTLLGLKTMDCTSGFRCYRSNVLSSLNLEENIISRRYIFLVELLFLFHRNNLRIAETPIIFVNRVAGKTKVNIKEMLQGLLTIFRLRLKYRFFEK